MKRAFFVSASVWLIGGALLRIASIQNGYSGVQEDFQSLFFFFFGSLTIISAAILLGRWIVKMRKRQPSVKLTQPFERNPLPKPRGEVQIPKSVEEPAPERSERWHALIRYDDQLSAAAEQLRPFGEHWVDKLGYDYFALGEDRRYLANIIQKLLDEANQEQRLREQREALTFATRFRETADGEICTEDSIAVLREAQARGYTLGLERNKSFSLAKGSGMTFLYSNADIERLARLMAHSSDQS